MSGTVIAALVAGLATIIAASIGAYRAGRSSRVQEQIQRDTLDLSAMQATTATFQALGEAQAQMIVSLQGQNATLQSRVNYLETNWQPKGSNK